MDLDEKSRILMNELAKDFSKRGDIFRIFLGMANRKLKVDEFEDTLQDMVVSIGKGGHTYEHEVHEGREEFNDEITYLKLYPVLDELAPEQREFIDLHYFQGLELKEIALKTGLKESTIRGRLYEARKTLREILPYSIVNKRGKIREAA